MRLLKFTYFSNLPLVNQWIPQSTLILDKKLMPLGSETSQVLKETKLLLL